MRKETGPTSSARTAAMPLSRHGFSDLMTLYFAYRANMERAAMRARCPGAAALGPARLSGWRYVIASGYGSVAQAPGAGVFGVLWRLSPHDLAALNVFESLDSGL